MPEPKIAPTGPIREAADYRARFPDGRIGSDPTLATIDKGQQIIDAAAESLLKDIARFSAEVMPSKASAKVVT